MSEAGDLVDNVSEIRKADWGSDIVGPTIQQATDGLAAELAGKYGLGETDAAGLQASLRMHTVGVVRATQDQLRPAENADGSVATVTKLHSAGADVIDLDSRRTVINDGDDAA